jgi:Tfp pilus assembly protein PilX
MKNNCLFSPKEKGAALFFSLLIGVVMVGLALPFLFKMNSQFHITEKSYKSLSALNLAEAGVERAIWELNFGDISTWSGNLLERNLTLTSVQTAQGFVIGSIDITVLNPASDYPLVMSKGIVPWRGDLSIEKSLCVSLTHGTESYFNFAVFGNEGFDIHGNTYTNSYNSDLGAYDPDNPGDSGDIGTNATHQWDVVLLNNTVVNGNATTGYGSDPEYVIKLKNSAEILGEMKTLTEPKPLPACEPPFLTQRGVFSLGNNAAPVTITESGTYTEFTMGSNTKVTISGDVTLYVDGNFTMNSNAILEILPGSSLELVLGNGTFRQESNTQVNNLTQDPKNLAIMGTAEFKNMIWRANTEFWGVIYVPEATVDYASTGDLYGSIVADYLSMSSNAGIHYDESLRTWDKYVAQTNSLIMRYWQERNP